MTGKSSSLRMEIRSGRRRRFVRLLLLMALSLFAFGCRQDMHDQPRIEAYEENAFFADGVGSRPIPAGTVARGNLRDDTHLYEGVDAAGDVLDALPPSMEMTSDLLWRGQERYEIYCSVCHGSTGAGDGMIVRRGFKQPPPLYEDRLVNLPLGYYYDVMTNGYGVMSSYANQVPVEDRWAIAAYIRALQVSQASSFEALPAEVQTAFHESLAAGAEEHGEGHGDGHGEGEHGDGSEGEHH